MAGSPDVTAEDQQRLNAFNKTWQRLKEIDASLEGKKKLREDCEDASNELILNDEEHVRYVLGECFFHATNEEAEERLSKCSEVVEKEQGELEEEKSRLQTEMQQLKDVLYSRLGNSINLEE